jgi:hypothetical protein
MRAVSVLGIAAVAVTLIAAVSPSSAGQRRRSTWSDAWDMAMQAAEPELRDCAQLGAAGRVFGDVHVHVDPRSRRWTTSASHSLGRLRRKLATCVRRAIARHLDFSGAHPDALDRGHGFEHTTRIGTPTILLPPARVLMPVWRRAVTGAGRDARQARTELRKLLPPDYALTGDNCFTTPSAAVLAAENLWLPSVGLPVSEMWHDSIEKAIGRDVAAAVWDPSGALITRISSWAFAREPARRAKPWPPSGLCLEPFDSVRQAVGEPYQRTGTAIVDVTFTAKAQRVRVPMHANGTGLSISGRVELVHGSAVVTGGIHVSATCAGTGEIPVFRRALTGATGEFEILDVGAPPCRVGAGTGREVKIDTLPANGVVLGGGMPTRN